MGLPRLKRVLCAALAVLLLALASVALADVTVYVAPYSGTKYHSRKSCRGLNNARRIKAYKLSELPSKYKPCSICASGSKYQRSSSSSKATKKPTAKPTSKPTAKPTALVAAAPYASPDPLDTDEVTDDEYVKPSLLDDVIWFVSNYPLQVFLGMLSINYLSPHHPTKIAQN